MAWAAELLFALLYVLLDWASYLRPLVEGFNITPWNPQQALAVAFLVRRPSRAWVVFAAVGAAEVLVRGWPVDSLAPWAAAGALSLTFLAVARALGPEREDATLFDTRATLVRFAVAVTAGALAAAIGYVTILSSAEGSLGSSVGARILSYWVGDAVGLLVTLPLLLAAMNAAGRARLLETLGHPTMWLAAAFTCGGLWLVFGRGEQDYFKFFYVLMLPVAWCSVRFGVAGAVLSANLTQVGLIVAVQGTMQRDLTVFELQALMAASGVTALLLGVLVDERARAEAEARKSLRFSAAGQLAAGLAHELGQPLTAMNNYGEACRLLVDRQPEQREQLVAAMGRMLDEAGRAAQVARRLRDFFTNGAITIEVTDLGPLLDAAVREQQRAAGRAGVQLECAIDASLPPVWIDAVQIAVVVRNLLANAIEAAGAGEAPRVVALQATVHDAELHVAVLDSGAGVPAARLQVLFDAAHSAKSSGMGVGLSICRSIVEAHGGRLWAAPGPGGRFIFTLPVGNT
ncbi:MAG: MASE1 domain-containing protein [Burkholderiales bacterium]|nr:MASE1 domain-containing protein [Burkholderiales bacterium]